MSKPNRYFQAFVEVRMPWCTHKAWGPYASEIVLFEQPDMPAYDDIVSAVKPSPPHRWLRKSDLLHQAVRRTSPPHRWLRKLRKIIKSIVDPSPPHRWLRKSVAC